MAFFRRNDFDKTFMTIHCYDNKESELGALSAIEREKQETSGGYDLFIAE